MRKVMIILFATGLVLVFSGCHETHPVWLVGPYWYNGPLWYVVGG